MTKIITTADFIKKARAIHGDKYDYSLVRYTRAKDKVRIICPLHGEFMQDPHHHYRYKGCPKCKRDALKSIIFGVGVNDLYDESKCKSSAYNEWRKMLQRCYDPKYTKVRKDGRRPTVCEEWKLFSNFKKWHDENYVDGYHLDKDILSKEQYYYSPETCLYVPQSINDMFTMSQANNSNKNVPLGVTFEKRSGKYRMQFTKNCKHVSGKYYDNPIDAFEEYKAQKEAYIKEVAEEYFAKQLITEKVYKALLDYKIENICGLKENKEQTI